jgi:sugar phosphate permease
VLLSSVPAHRSGVASGVFNTARQVGGALAVAVFGALVAAGGGFEHGQRISLFVMAAVALMAAAAAAALVHGRPQPTGVQRHPSSSPAQPSVGPAGREGTSSNGIG